MHWVAIGAAMGGAEVVDRRWRALLDEHNRPVRRELEPFRGTDIKTTGDGVLATFDGPRRAPPWSPGPSVRPGLQ